MSQSKELFLAAIASTEHTQEKLWRIYRCIEERRKYIPEGEKLFSWENDFYSVFDLMEYAELESPGIIRNMNPGQSAKIRSLGITGLAETIEKCRTEKMPDQEIIALFNDHSAARKELLNWVMRELDNCE